MEMTELMAQAKELQDKVASAQDKLGNTRIKGIAEDGACIVDITGKYDLIGIKLSPDALSRGADGVAKLVTAAYRDAKAKADKLIDEVMGAATAGIPLPM